MASKGKLLVIAGKPINIISIQNCTRARSSSKLNNIESATTVLNTSAVSVKAVKNEKVKRKSSATSQLNKRLNTIPRPNVLYSYLSYIEILQYLDYLKIRYNDFVKLHTLGYSYERRPIRAIEIHWNSESNIWAQAKEHRERLANEFNTQLDELDICAPQAGRNIVFIEGGTHAREWITIAVALHCIYQLTEKNGRHRDLLTKLRFFIVPVVNPDGYEYSKSTNPRWRKNRRPHTADNYVGTDCNRNFDFHWDQCKSVVNKNTYQGEKPFSESESKAIAQILNKLAPKMLLFLSLHSYAQCIMYPWGYTKCLPNNAKLLERVAMAGRNAIKSNSGRYYRVGSIAQLSKRTIAGSVVDYAYGVVKVPLSLVMELPSHEYGFQPPSDKIFPLSSESWCGISEMCKQAYTLKSQLDEPQKESPNAPIKGVCPKEEVINEKSTEINNQNDAMPNLMESTENVLRNIDKFDRKIKPSLNVNKVESSVPGAYFTSLLDAV